MRKTFQVDGYAVNKRGNTVGIHYPDQRQPGYSQIDHLITGAAGRL